VQAVGCLTLYLIFLRGIKMKITQIIGGLLTDSSKVNLKVILLHNGSRFPSLHLAHAANMKESHESMKLLLGTIKYGEFKWKLCGDLKVVALLLGMKLGVHEILLFLLRVGQRGTRRIVM